MISNKCFYIQVFGEQKHPDPNALNNKLSTKEFFEKDKENANNNSIGKLSNKTVDPESQKLKEDLNVAMMKQQRYEFTIVNIQKLIGVANGTPINPAILQALMQSSSEQEASGILNDFNKKNGGIFEELAFYMLKN